MRALDYLVVTGLTLGLAYLIVGTATQQVAHSLNMTAERIEAASR